MSTTDARPRPRAFWADVRFLLGIVLIVGSIAGVWAVVAAARQTVPALAAARAIIPGQPIVDGDLRVVDVALGALADGYLAPGALTPDQVARRTIAPGELIPRSAIQSADDARTTTVVLRSDVPVPDSVTTGSGVEVWAAPEREDEPGLHDPPRILVPAATVVAVLRSDSVMGGGDTSLELVIPRSDVPAALAAMTGDSRLSVVPATGVAP